MRRLLARILTSRSPITSLGDDGHLIRMNLFGGTILFEVERVD